MKVLTQEIPLLNTTIKLFVRREDLIHPIVSGNKYRKLKYNLIQAKQSGANKLITFGGAFSNHIAATAYVGSVNGFGTIGIIRGEELESKIDSNPTLKFAQSCGMIFKFIPREEYRLKDTDQFLYKLKSEFDQFYIVPEGGTNEYAIKGCEEILEKNDSIYDYIMCSIGTGGTISGIINSSSSNQKILGFPSLKGDFLRKDICKFAKNDNWDLIDQYHFGGYGKISPELISFINSFKQKNNIPLDPIYTGKMVFGVLDLIHKDYFPKNSKILMIHTGGLQGIEGMNLKLKSKNLPIINV